MSQFPLVSRPKVHHIAAAARKAFPRFTLQVDATSIPRVGLHIVAILTFSGCATTSTPQIVKVPVPQPCITADQLPKPPDAKNDAELTKMDDFDFVITLAADRLEYRRYANEAQAVLQACVK